MKTLESINIAVLIPCYNEANTIAEVVTSFKKYLPTADIYVYDNRSEDNTAELAKEAGASVRTAKIRGKGNVVRRMFYDIEADVYAMVDGDSTYTAADAPKMINALIREKVDMVVAIRQEKSETAYRSGHKFGNKMFNFILKILFDSAFQDIFSGYRVFSRRFVKTFPVMTNGFDIEAELSIHALTLDIPYAEINSTYLERPTNSHSKLNTLGDGFKILVSIIRLLKEIKPLFFFSLISLILFLMSVGISYPIIITFIESGLVPRLPTAVLSMGIMLFSFLSFTCGVILDGIGRTHIEVKKLNYLAYHKVFH
ncbi:MAG: glycosyltransferase family 2 protein [Holosporaceae bacterium]|jgi:glycosyltransferase involved in cell wall biosynthesis|nr:glycosyltransferase family 2 protein [Holosporaceae bacterium]